MDYGNSRNIGFWNVYKIELCMVLGVEFDIGSTDGCPKDPVRTDVYKEHLLTLRTPEKQREYLRYFLHNLPDNDHQAYDVYAELEVIDCGAMKNYITI